MPELMIKGVRIGVGRPKAVVSLMGGTIEELVATAGRAITQGADCLEWRADHFPGIGDARAVCEACRTLGTALSQVPLICTMRSTGQGGALGLPAEEHVALLRAVIEGGGPDLVDIEANIGDDAVRELVARAHERDVRVIVSHHDFAGTPETERMVALLVHLASLGADIPKLAVMARATPDAHRLMRATALARERLDVPLATMAMGAAGQRTRLTGEVFGSALTFCALGAASAPGQVELAEALEAMEAVHRMAVAGTERPSTGAGGIVEG